MYVYIYIYANANYAMQLSDDISKILAMPIHCQLMVWLIIVSWLKDFRFLKRQQKLISGTNAVKISKHRAFIGFLAKKKINHGVEMNNMKMCNGLMSYSPSIKKQKQKKKDPKLVYNQEQPKRGFIFLFF